MVDTSGAIEVLKIPPGPYEVPRMSPDGKRIAFGSNDDGNLSIWVYDLSGASAARRLTFGGNCRFPMWSADSQRVAFQSDREGDAGIFWQGATARAGEHLTRADKGTFHVPESWALKGERFVLSVTRDTKTTLGTFSLKDRKATQFDAVESLTPTGAVFSPDGQWLAYSTRESIAQASNILYVQPFPPTGVKYQISATIDDGHHPAFSPDGSQLLYGTRAGPICLCAGHDAPELLIRPPDGRRASVFHGGPDLHANL